MFLRHHRLRIHKWILIYEIPNSSTNFIHNFLSLQIRKESDMDFDEDRSHIWLIYCDNGDRKCVMTTNKNESNWLREVQPAESSVNANVLAISIGNQLYLVTGPSGIPPFTKVHFLKEWRMTYELCDNIRIGVFHSFWRVQNFLMAKFWVAVIGDTTT